LGGPREGVAFETIRDILLRRGRDLVGGELTDYSRDPLADATYIFLRGLPDLDLSVDGWTSFHVIRETEVSLTAVGIMTVLPADDLPLEVEFSTESNETRYLVRVGLVDERWHSLSESKRWKSVYLYATQGRDIDWTWSEPISGQLTPLGG
jgi:hypothetical protein